MDKFQQMQTFVAVAEERGFSAAARRLATSAPAVTRLIAALEAQLGVKLLDRTTRSVRVTEAGQRYLEDTRQILGAVAAADEAAAGINASPSGHLAVTAPVLFGRKFVTPAVVEYLQRYPGTEVNMMFVDRVVNLIEEGLDVGVRIGHLPDSSMRAIRVGEVRRVLVATQQYIDDHGAPKTPEDLHNHTLIASSAGDMGNSWRFGANSELALRITPRLSTTTNDSAVEAALAGFGIARLLSYQVLDELNDGRLVRVLPEFEPAPFPVHIVHREGRYAAARVRGFIDLLAVSLRNVGSIS